MILGKYYERSGKRKQWEKTDKYGRREKEKSGGYVSKQ